MKQNSNTKQNTIPLFFASDDNYIPFLVVTLESIVRNASKENEYIFYILNNGLKEENVKKVNKYNFANFKVEFVNVAKKMEKIGSTLHTRDYYSKSTYYRLFIPSMFPEYDKVLYLDCDITVLSDIADLYNTELGSNYVGAIVDESVQIVPEFKVYTDNFLGVISNKYFNAGILLMNLKELRDADFETKFINLISTYTFDVAQDQDYLNVICKDKVTYIDGTWNKMPFASDIKKEDINLIHYNLSFKPWKYSDILYQEEFWKYAELAGIKKQIEDIKAQFTPEKQRIDQEGGKRLIEKTYQQGMQKDTYYSLVKNGEIDTNTYLRVEKYDASKVLNEIITNVKDDVNSKVEKKRTR